jgi:hypothetical protein
MLTREEYNNLPDLKLQALVKMYEELGTATAVAEHIGLSVVQICFYLRRAGCKLRRGPRPNPGINLIDETIYKEYQQPGVTLETLGKKYDVTRERIRQRLSRYEEAIGLGKVRHMYTPVPKICGNPACQNEVPKGHRQNKYCSSECSKLMHIDAIRHKLPLSEMVELYNKGYGFYVLSRLYNELPTTIHRHFKQAGIATRPRPPQWRLPPAETKL